MKRNVKRMFSLLLALVLCIGLFPTFALAGETEEPAEETAAVEETLAETETPSEPEETEQTGEPQLPDEPETGEETEEAEYSEDIPEEDEAMASSREPDPGENILTPEFFPDAYLLQCIKDYYLVSSMTASEAAEKVSLNVEGSAEAGVSDITGLVRFFPNLSSLKLNYSRCKSINLKGLTKLEYLELYDNRLQSLDLSGMASLKTLYTDSNNLPDTTIETLNVSGTSIRNLYLYHYDNLKSFSCAGCSELEYVECDRCALLKKADMSDCPKLYDIDSEYSPCLTEVNLTGSGSEGKSGYNTNYDFDNCCSLTGLDLRDCSTLYRLECSECEAMTELDLSGLANLNMVFAGYTGINRIDVSASKNTLEYLNCSYSNVAELDLSNFTALRELQCSKTGLKKLNLTGCSMLEKVYASDNSLRTIELGGCTQLKNISASESGIEYLNLTDCINLEDLALRENKLANLDITMCTKLQNPNIGEQYPDKKLTAYAVGYKGTNGHSLYMADIAELAGNSSGITDVNCYTGYVVKDTASDSAHYFVLIDGTAYAQGLEEDYDSYYFFRYNYSPRSGCQFEVRADIQFSDKPFVTGLSTDYLIMGSNSSGESLIVNTVFGDLPACFTAVWTSSDDDIVSVTDGYLQHAWASEKTGTATVTVDIKMPAGTETVFERLSARVDVTDGAVAGENGVFGVSLPEKKATVELYKTDYTEFDVILLAEQNLQYSEAAGILPEEDVPHPLSEGTAIQSAEFTSAGVSKYFDLVPVNDRTLRIVPVYEKMAAAYNDPKNNKIPSTLKSTVKVKVGGVYYETVEILTITVKQSKPSLKAAAITLNTNPQLLGREKPIVFSGAAVTGVAQDNVAPAWLKYNAVAQTFAYTGAGNAKASANMKFLCTVEGWAVEAPVTVKVTAKPVAPTLKFSQKSVTLAGGTDDRARIICTVSDEFAGCNISLLRITEGKGKTLRDVTYDNILYLIPDSSGVVFDVCNSADRAGDHTYTIWLGLGGKEFSLNVKVTDPGRPPETIALKLSGTADLGREGSTLKVVPSIKNCAKSNGYIYNIKRIYRADDPLWKDVKDEFKGATYTNQKEFSISAKYPYTNLQPGVYFIEVTADLGNGITASGKTRFTVVQSAESSFRPSASIKVNGWVDPIRENQLAVVKVTYKGFDDSTVTGSDVKLYYKDGKEYKHLDGISAYHNDYYGGYVIRANYNNNLAGIGQKVYARFEGTVSNNGNEIPVYSQYAPVTFKMSKIKCVAGTAIPSLSLKDCNDRAAFEMKIDGGAGDRLLEVTDVKIADAKYADMFELVLPGKAGDGTLNPETYQIKWKDGLLPAAPMKAGSTISVKLNVFVAGNITDFEKPDSTVTLKLKLT